MELRYTPLIADANLKAYYRLEAGALTTDSSGQGHTLTNNNTVGEASGKFGGAADFGTANTNKGLAIADKLDIDGGACSFSLWVKIRTEITVNGTVYMLVCQGGSATDTVNQIYYTQTSGVKQVCFNRYKNTLGGQGVTVNQTLGTTDWFHLVYTYDTTNVRAYINGVLQGSPVAASGNGSNGLGDSFAIGKNSISNIQCSNAYIDDVAVFNKALSAAEVHKLYKESAPAFLMNLASNWKNN